jgi:hypothetical protein
MKGPVPLILTKFFETADHFWRTIGGAGWSMLTMYTTLIWTNVKHQRAAFVDATGELR